MVLPKDVQFYLDTIDWSIYGGQVFASESSDEARKSARTFAAEMEGVVELAHQNFVVHEEEGCSLVEEDLSGLESKLELHGPVVYPEPRPSEGYRAVKLPGKGDTSMRTLLDQCAGRGFTGITTSFQDGLGGSMTLYSLLTERLGAGNTALLVGKGLTDDVANMIEALGETWMKELYIPLLRDGTFDGAMVMTEPDCGSDLGGITTRATEITEGKYAGACKINGAKCFITSPDADVCIVLARDNEGYEVGSTRGLSAYVVPKVLVEDGGSGRVATRNNFYITGDLLKKKGMKTSPTALIQFDDAIGYRIGKKGQGLLHFFELMNFARIMVGTQALALAQDSLDAALDYADRGNTPRTVYAKNPMAGQDGQPKFVKVPISTKSPVKEMLVNGTVNTEASRALLYAASMAVDDAVALKMRLHSGDPEVTAENVATRNYEATTLGCLVKFYAPLSAKGVTDDGVEVHGGNGFTREYRVSALQSCVVITNIYEGTAEIQATQIAKWVVAGQFDNELNMMADYLGGKEDGSGVLLSDKLKEFRAWTEFLRGKSDEVRDLHSKRLTTRLADLYCGYTLLQQGEKNTRKQLIADKFIFGKFDPDGEYVRNDTSTIDRFREIVYHEAA